MTSHNTSPYCACFSTLFCSCIRTIPWHNVTLLDFTRYFSRLFSVTQKYVKLSDIMLYYLTLDDIHLQYRLTLLAVSQYYSLLLNFAFDAEDYTKLNDFRLDIIRPFWKSLNAILDSSFNPIHKLKPFNIKTHPLPRSIKRIQQIASH